MPKANGDGLDGFFGCDSNCGPAGVGLGRPPYTVPVVDGQWKMFAPTISPPVDATTEYADQTYTLTIMATAPGSTPISKTATLLAEHPYDQPSVSQGLPNVLHQPGVPACASINDSASQPIRPANKLTVTAGKSVTFTCSWRAPELSNYLQNQWADGTNLTFVSTHDSANPMYEPSITGIFSRSSASFDKPAARQCGGNPYTCTFDTSKDVVVDYRVQTSTTTPAGVYVFGFGSKNPTGYYRVGPEGILTVTAAQTSTPTPSPTATESSPANSPSSVTSPSSSSSAISTPISQQSATSSPTTPTPNLSTASPSPNITESFSFPNPVIGNTVTPPTANQSEELMATKDTGPGSTSPQISDLTSQAISSYSLNVSGRVSVTKTVPAQGISVSLGNSTVITDKRGNYSLTAGSSDLAHFPRQVTFDRPDLISQTIDLAETVSTDHPIVFVKRNPDLKSKSEIPKLTVNANPALGGTKLLVTAEQLPPNKPLAVYWNPYVVKVGSVEGENLANYEQRGVFKPKLNLPGPAVSDAQGNLSFTINTPILPGRYTLLVTTLPTFTAKPNSNITNYPYGPETVAAEIGVTIPNGETYLEQLEKDLAAEIGQPAPDIQIASDQLNLYLESLRLTTTLSDAFGSQPQAATAVPAVSRQLVGGSATVTLDGVSSPSCEALSQMPRKQFTELVHILFEKIRAANSGCDQLAGNNDFYNLGEQTEAIKSYNSIKNARDRYLTEYNSNNQKFAADKGLRDLYKAQANRLIAQINSLVGQFANYPIYLSAINTDIIPSLGRVVTILNNYEGIKIVPDPNQSGSETALSVPPIQLKNAWHLVSGVVLTIYINGQPLGSYSGGQPTSVFVDQARALVDARALREALREGKKVEIVITGQRPTFVDQRPYNQRLTLARSTDPALSEDDKNKALEQLLTQTWNQLEPVFVPGVFNDRTKIFTPLDLKKAQGMEVDIKGYQLAKLLDRLRNLDKQPTLPFPDGSIALGKPSQGKLNLGGVSDDSYAVYVVEPVGESRNLWGPKEIAVRWYCYLVSDNESQVSPRACTSNGNDFDVRYFRSKELGQAYIDDWKKLGSDNQGNVNDLAMRLIENYHAVNRATQLADFDSQITSLLTQFKSATVKAETLGVTVTGDYAFISRSSGSKNRALAAEPEAANNQAPRRLANYLRLNLTGTVGQLLVTDPLGRAAGINPLNGEKVTQIPGAVVTGAGTTDLEIYLPQIVGGQYRLLLGGADGAAVRLSTLVAIGDGLPQTSQYDLTLKQGEYHSGAIDVNLETIPTKSGLAYGLEVMGFWLKHKIIIWAPILFLICLLGFILYRRRHHRRLAFH